MTDLPLISVITPCYNSAATIERTFQSVAEQNYPNLEYFVLDAGSTDGTQTIIERYSNLITYSHSQKDDGPNDAYNQGIAMAKGIICLLNADDWLEPGILTQVGQAFSHNPDAEIVTCEAKVWEIQEGVVKEVKHLRDKSQELSPYGTPMPNARFYKKAIFERFGQYEVFNPDGSRMIASDLEYLLRMSCTPPQHYTLPVVGYNYLISEASLTFAKNEARERQMYEERARIAGYYLSHPQYPEFGQKHAKRLKRWVLRGTSKAFFWHLLGGDVKKAAQTAKIGLSTCGLRWIAEVLRLTLTAKGGKL